ncbi:Hypothetical predicted protein [Podarcis lilfordi]|uniref:Uncharacterized protein n=1 Tax=Podarcis lilfordi TaxID=74358 RepID=A0AA35LD81_9SAUR|nr:Hypothetical predicted protein [Podarcis lilfordi]
MDLEARKWRQPSLSGDLYTVSGTCRIHLKLGGNLQRCRCRVIICGRAPATRCLLRVSLKIK